MTKEPIWYSYWGGRSTEDQLGYFDPSDFEWAQTLEANWEEIHQEVAAYIQAREADIKPYFNKSLITEKSIWRTSGFFFWGWPMKQNMKTCPKTMKWMLSVPNMVSTRRKSRNCVKRFRCPIALSR